MLMGLDCMRWEHISISQAVWQRLVPSELCMVGETGKQSTTEDRAC